VLTNFQYIITHAWMHRQPKTKYLQQLSPADIKIWPTFSIKVWWSSNQSLSRQLCTFTAL